MREGFELPQGIDNPRVDEFSQGEETPGMATEGEGVPGEVRRGQVGDRTPPTTEATEDRGANGGNEVMMRGLMTVAPPRPQRGMTADDNSAGPQQQQSSGVDGARPKNGMHSCREYSLLAPEVLEGGPATFGPRIRGDVHGTKRGTADHGRTETNTGENTGHRALLSRNMQEDGDKERSPSKQSRSLNGCGHQGEGGGEGSLTW